MCANPDAGESGRLYNGADVGPGDEVRLSLGDCLSGGISLRLGPGVDTEQSAGLSRSESVLLRLGAVNDLSGDPYASGRYQLRGSHDLCPGH